MKKNILLLLILLQIILLLFLSQSLSSTFQEGVLKEIRYSTNRISITLENNPIELIIFPNEILNIKKGDKIKFSGRKEIYQNKTQIIAYKIIKSNE